MREGPTIYIACAKCMTTLAVMHPQYADTARYSVYCACRENKEREMRVNAQGALKEARLMLVGLKVQLRKVAHRLYLTRDRLREEQKLAAAYYDELTKLKAQHTRLKDDYETIRLRELGQQNELQQLRVYKYFHDGDSASTVRLEMDRYRQLCKTEEEHKLCSQKSTSSVSSLLTRVFARVFGR
jgi:hypothetical protein